MNHLWTLDIAGCSCPLSDPQAIFSALACVSAAFPRRAQAYRGDARNPHLCRAYGFPTDAYAVEGDVVVVVRSLCHLDGGLDLQEVIPGKDLKQQLADLSTRVGSGRHWSRFTSIEAILARVRRPATGDISAAILDAEKPCAGQQ